MRREWFETPNSVLDIVSNDDNQSLYANILLRIRGLDPKTTRIIMGRKVPLLLPGNQSPRGLQDREVFLSALHRFFNPMVTKRLPGVRFYVGDLVRSTRNVTMVGMDGGLELVVTNGSEGTVVCVTPLTVVFYGGYTMTQADDNTEVVRGLFETLECGFLSTVHKFQGSEAKTVLAVFMGDFVDHNTVQLLYTAVSRSQQQLVLIMEQQNFDLYCTRPGQVVRNQGFNVRLIEGLDVV
jgi:ATP-dependent exoDNAse (exonuclease V) alpha subunit